MRALVILLLASGAVLTPPRAASAQEAVVRGVVRDSTGGPLPGASVYLSGTARGDATDAAGRYAIAGVPPGAYRVVASMVGFAPAAEPVVLAAGDTLTVALVLRERPLALGTARVEGERDRRWERRLARFTREIIGESTLADSTRILNPEVLDFRSRWGTLTATARAPLVIENRALGYRLHYDLLHFEAAATRVSYDGDERFEALAPASAPEAARWAAARERAYRGSLQHLLRALLEGRAREEGFGLTYTATTGAALRAGGPAFRTSGRRLMRTDARGWGTLRLRGRLHVSYQEREDGGYPRSAWFPERPRRPTTVQRSSLVVDGEARVDPQGTPEDPFAITTSGYLGFERLADRVPEGYHAAGAE